MGPHEHELMRNNDQDKAGSCGFSNRRIFLLQQRERGTGMPPHADHNEGLPDDDGIGSSKMLSKKREGMMPQFIEKITPSL